MAQSIDSKDASPGPGQTHRFISQAILPLAIAWATAVENAGYQASQTVREHPGKSAICALTLGFAIAVVRAKAERKLRKI
ncbi:hypothetical protein [Acidisoma silvae]|uniref:Uncharacterized protein n=1 Tax=Acidisoma silvae TaxID=2802396 RepID=A0A964E1K4_9PROT|nr:hypothetical protein [Acidisoma silvae]MCB8878342.1 hypothetical protein [Acidisoma silvae]